MATILHSTDIEHFPHSRKFYWTVLTTSACTSKVWRRLKDSLTLRTVRKTGWFRKLGVQTHNTNMTSSRPLKAPSHGLLTDTQSYNSPSWYKQEQLWASESDPGSNPSPTSELPYDFVSLLPAECSHLYKMWIRQVVKIWGEMKLVCMPCRSYIFNVHSVCKLWIFR